LENNQLTPEKLHLYASELKNQLTHTSNLMEKLLNWAVSQMQGFKPSIQSTNLLETVNEVSKAMEQLASKKNVIIQHSIPADVQVMADKDMLALIVRNLIGNAIKFSFMDGVVELGTMVENGQTIFSVKDHGIGIKEEKMKLINASAAMSIESSAGTQNEKGTGLGLMLCKTFASLMEGAIVARNAKDGGTEFKLMLKNKDS
jgi:signal transduction histidine kinase